MVGGQCDALGLVRPADGSDFSWKRELVVNGQAVANRRDGGLGKHQTVSV
jgi:hypothetical protein